MNQNNADSIIVAKDGLVAGDAQKGSFATRTTVTLAPTVLIGNVHPFRSITNIPKDHEQLHPQQRVLHKETG